MAGLVEIQQILTHGTMTEKIQQAHDGTLESYQQAAAAEMKQKDIRRQRETNKSSKTDDARIRDGRKRHADAHEGGRHDGSEATPDEDDSENPGHMIDVIA